MPLPAGAGTSQPAASHQRLAHLPRAIHGLHLRELTPQQVRDLIDGLVGSGTLAQSAKEDIYAQCHGNPFFLEEILHALIDKGVMVDTGSRWEVRGELAPIQAPAGVQSVTLSRADRRAPQVKATLQQAAVLVAVSTNRCWLRCSATISM